MPRPEAASKPAREGLLGDRQHIRYCSSAHRLALEPFECLWIVGEGKDVAPFHAKQCSLHGRWRHVEELTVCVHKVHTPIRELPVQRVLESDRVIAEEQSMNVEPKRNRRVAKLTHSVERLQAPGESDLHHLVAE